MAERRERLVRYERAREARFLQQEMAGVLWLDSDEYKKMNRWTVALLVAFTVLILGALTVSLISARQQGTEGGPLDTYSPFDNWQLFASVMGTSVASFIIFLTYRGRRKQHFLDRQRLGLARDLQDKEQAIAESGEELTLASLWAVNQSRIEYYHGIASAQSESSFKNGTIASFAGFGLLLVVGGVGAFSVSIGASIAVGVVGLAGAAMASYLGATFMKTQADASAQLRQFFLQPVEFSRLLGAERLIETLPEKDRAAAVQQVIAAMVATPSMDREANRAS